MKIKLEEEVFEVSNQIENVDELFNLINKKIEAGHLELSHLIIDGIPVYREYKEYVSKYIEKIETVEVMCNHQERLVKETLMSTYDYLIKAVSAIQVLAEVFYQNPKEETWSDLADLFEGIQWIIDTQNHIDQIKDLDTIIINYPLWNEYVQLIKRIIPVLPDLEEAMGNKDHVLIGDLLLYEIMPIFEDCVNKLRFLIPGEGIDYVS